MKAILGGAKLVALAVLLSAPVAAMAWDFGPMTVTSKANELFRAQVQVLNVKAEDGGVFVHRVTTRSMSDGTQPWKDLKVSVDSKSGASVVNLSMDKAPGATPLDIVLEGVSGGDRVLQNYPVTFSSANAASSFGLDRVALLD